MSNRSAGNVRCFLTSTSFGSRENKYELNPLPGSSVVNYASSRRICREDHWGALQLTSQTRTRFFYSISHLLPPSHCRTDFVDQVDPLAGVYPQLTQKAHSCININNLPLSSSALRGRREPLNCRFSWAQKERGSEGGTLRGRPVHWPLCVKRQRSVKCRGPHAGAPARTSSGVPTAGV